MWIRKTMTARVSAGPCRAQDDCRRPQEQGKRWRVPLIAARHSAITKDRAQVEFTEESTVIGAMGR